MFKVWFWGYFRCSRVCHWKHLDTVLWEILLGLLGKNDNKVKFHSEWKSQCRNKTWESDFSGHYGQLWPENFLWPIILMSLRARNFWQMVRWTKNWARLWTSSGQWGWLCGRVVAFEIKDSRFDSHRLLSTNINQQWHLYFRRDVSKCKRGQGLSILKALTGLIGGLKF